MKCPAEDAGWHQAAAVWLGQRGHGDSTKAGTRVGHDRRSRCVSAVLVLARAPEAGRFDERSRSGLHNYRQPPVESVPEGLPQTLYRAHRVVDELSCGSIQDDAFHCIGRSGAVAADWLWKRGELIARASNHPRERVRDTLGAWSEPLAIDSSTAGGKHDPGDGRRGGGHVVSMGRIEVFSGADAAEYYPRRSSDPPEHTSAVVHYRSSRTDGGCVCSYSVIESVAERCE